MHMSLTDNIMEYLRGEKKKKAPDGVCPNCWGRQEYEGKFRQILHMERINTNNLDQKKGWIQAYAARQFEGIQLKKTDDLYECPNCKLTYRPEGSQQA